MSCPGWPDVVCSEGRSARSLLNEIAARAASFVTSEALQIRSAASRWRDRAGAALSCEERCAKVYAAHAALMEQPPAWALALQALADDGAIPETAAALAASPTVVVEPPEPGTAPSRSPSPARPPRPPRKRKAAKKKKPTRGRAKKPARRVGKKAGKAVRRRGRKPKRPAKKVRASRARPRRRRSR
jgi:hypothetical protein